MSSPLVPTSPFLNFNAAPAEPWARGATVGKTAEIFEAHYADQTAVKRAVGFEDGTLEPIIDAETAAHEVSAAVWDAIGDTPAAFQVRGDVGVVSATNPSFIGTAGFNSISLTFSQNALATAEVGMYVDGAILRSESP